MATGGQGFPLLDFLGLRSPTGACDTNGESAQPEIPRLFRRRSCRIVASHLWRLIYTFGQQGSLKEDNLLALGIGSMPIGRSFAWSDRGAGFRCGEVGVGLVPGDMGL